MIVVFCGACGGDETVAQVDGETIGLKEYQRQLRILKSLRPDTKADEATRRQLLEQMVKQQLLTMEAKRQGLDKDPSVAEAIKRQRESVRDELLASLKNTQAQLEQLDRAVEQKVLIERLLDAHRKEISVSEAEIKKAYAERKQQSPSVGPMMQIRDQLLQQLQVEKLVEQAKPGRRIELYPDVAAKGSLD